MYVQLLQDTGGVTGKYRVSICLNTDWWSRYSLLHLTPLTAFKVVMGNQILLY